MWCVHGLDTAADAIAASIVGDPVLSPRVAVILNDRMMATLLKDTHPQLHLAMSMRDQVRVMGVQSRVHLSPYAALMLQQHTPWEAGNHEVSSTR